MCCKFNFMLLSKIKLFSNLWLEVAEVELLYYLVKVNISAEGKGSNIFFYIVLYSHGR